MNPVNATSLYVSACRSLMQCDPEDPETYGGLFNVLNFFRDSLSCLACGNLLQDPIAPKNSSCQHYVCMGCKGEKMMLKPSCSWCKDWEEFEENKQLQILVDCYRNLCDYVSVCMNTQQSALGVEGYPEVKKMLEEVLGTVKEEQEQFSISDAHSQTDNLDAPHIKTEVESSNNSIDVNPSGSDDTVDATELDTPKPVTVREPLNSKELNTDAVTVDVLNSIVSQASGAKLDTCSMETSETDFENKDCSAAQQHKTETPAEQSPQSSLTTGSSDHPQQPQTGMTCLAASHRKVRLSRKRSRSESDSEMIQPLPIASFIQGPSVAATAPAKSACEPKPPSQPAVVVSNGGVLKVNKAMLDLTKNIQVNADSGNKKVQSKSKVAVPKSKGKAKDRVLPASILPGQPTKVAYKKTQEKKGCKCGRATQNPSVLTCRGQRCPCYSNRKACLDCICRGCQNSYMANGEKKLEAFAVPEKALEQTRLTLGINLTSISVRNAGSNAGVLSLSAGSPMASFLTSSADEDQNFEDALEMHFDC
ncbi:LOW QUALITY PROTEIN: E3 ubiquitin-protein ligase MSL2a [Triplophysa dalaica]|uniref:LOW QUALITY PROTEIN: E3 ubiquitin-protein ligase MSL2a n=1 Tax=Triplophysa dalaica TaxID=1582913 RepID=UPI0024DFC2C4|nr:LOW QUALITY PROTEIN: E3 ubiquitin-protein ligase MSL2a [Triplophysa dalaica]